MIDIRNKPDLDFNFSEYIFERKSYLNKDICEKLIEDCKNKVVMGNPTIWSGSFHKCDLDNVDYVHSLFTDIWEEVTHYFNVKLDFIEPYHIKKYKLGNFYGEHIDNFTSKLDRKLSLVVQLSDSNSYSGGDLNIAGDKVIRDQGSIIIFPSQLKHKVHKVTFGERWVLITWAWGSIFNRG